MSLQYDLHYSLIDRHRSQVRRPDGLSNVNVICRHEVPPLILLLYIRYHHPIVKSKRLIIL
jgi:hypothetical protein